MFRSRRLNVTLSIIGVILMVVMMTVGFSALNTELSISGEANVRPDYDIRITGINFIGVGDAGFEKYTSEYSRNSVKLFPVLPTKESTVTYEIFIKNNTPFDYGISNIQIDEANLDYEIKSYKIKDKLCTNMSCNNGNTDRIELTIKYKDNMFNADNTEYAANLKFEFKNFTTIKYENIEADNYPKSIMEDDTLNITLPSNVFNLEITNNGVLLINGTDYSYKNNNLIIFNVPKGNIIIKYRESKLASYLKATSDKNNFFSNPALPRKKIESITFLESLDDMNETAFDISLKNDGTIMAWYTGNGPYQVYIGSSSEYDIYANSNSSNLFYDIAADKSCTDEYIFHNLNLLHTKDVTNMQSMFQYTGPNILTNLSFGNNFDTSNVTNMSSMFYGTGENVKAFKISGLSSFNISKLNNMSYMFSNTGKNSLKWDIGDLSSWDTSNVTNMLGVFAFAGYSAESWSIGDLSGWNTSRVTNMSAMFRKAGRAVNSFTLTGLSSWDTSNVTNMSNMFVDTGYVAKKWDIGDLSSWDVSNVTNMSNMFGWTGTNAEVWNAGDLSSWDTSNVTDMSSMFAGIASNSITNINIGNINIYASSTNNMFQNCKKINATINIYSNPTNYGSMFTNAALNTNSLITVNYSNNTTNIDSIIGTKSASSNVVKGNRLD